uniref:Uncharacterized protein n=1 Tax=Strongyloides venezuelensis TaxID=75913 RepID=A0A0K0G5P2_STRVS
MHSLSNDCFSFHSCHWSHEKFRLSFAQHVLNIFLLKESLFDKLIELSIRNKYNRNKKFLIEQYNCFKDIKQESDIKILFFLDEQLTGVSILTIFDNNLIMFTKFVQEKLFYFYELQTHLPKIEKIRNGIEKIIEKTSMLYCEFENQIKDKYHLSLIKLSNYIGLKSNLVMNIKYIKKIQGFNIYFEKMEDEMVKYNLVLENSVIISSKSLKKILEIYFVLNLMIPKLIVRNNTTILLKLLCVIGEFEDQNIFSNKILVQRDILLKINEFKKKYLTN